MDTGVKGQENSDHERTGFSMKRCHRKNLEHNQEGGIRDGTYICEVPLGIFAIHITKCIAPAATHGGRM